MQEKLVFKSGAFDVENDLKVNYEVREANLKGYVEIEFKMDYEIQSQEITEDFVISEFEMVSILKDFANLEKGIFNKFEVSKIEKKAIAFKNMSLLDLNDLELICNTINLTLSDDEKEVYYNGYAFGLSSDGEFHVDECLISSVWYFIEKYNEETINFYCLSKYDLIKFVCQSFMKSFINAIIDCEKSVNEIY